MGKSPTVHAAALALISLKRRARCCWWGGDVEGNWSSPCSPGTVSRLAREERAAAAPHCQRDGGEKAMRVLIRDRLSSFPLPVQLEEAPRVALRHTGEFAGDWKRSGSLSVKETGSIGFQPRQQVFTTLGGRGERAAEGLRLWQDGVLL